MSRVGAEKPQRDVKGKWAECSPETVAGFSGVAYFFGRDVQKALDVPVGLIHTSWGGTPAEAWTSRGTLEAEPMLKHYVENQAKALDNHPKALDKYKTDLAKHEEAVKKANLRGRGGAGFPAGIKWEGARKARRTPKYVICNAHEGEPNVFKDRRLLEGDPHAVLEGMIIEAFAVGTPWCYFYVGDEYPLAIHRTKEAVRTAYAAGLLGEFG